MPPPVSWASRELETVLEQLKKDVATLWGKQLDASSPAERKNWNIVSELMIVFTGISTENSETNN